MANGVLTVKYKKVHLCYDNNYTACIDLKAGEILLEAAPKFIRKLTPGFGSGTSPKLNIKTIDGYEWFFQLKRNNEFVYIDSDNLFYDGLSVQDSLSDGHLYFSVRPVLFSNDPYSTKVLDRDELKGYFGAAPGIAIVFEYC